MPGSARLLGRARATAETAARSSARSWPPPQHERAEQQLERDQHQRRQHQRRKQLAVHPPRVLDLRALELVQDGVKAALEPLAICDLEGLAAGLGSDLLQQLGV